MAKNDTFFAHIVATDKIYFEGRARYVNIETSDGQLGIMAHHAPIISAIDIGQLDIETEDGTWHHVAVGPGALSFANNRMTIIVDTLETFDQVDVRRAREAKERAEEELRQKQSVQEYKSSQASLARALTRLRISEDKHYI